MTNINSKVAYAPLVSIVISTKNRLADLKECLNSISKLSYENYEIIINDNNSTDGTVSYIRSKYPSVNLIASKVDMGAAEGKNIGLRQASGDFVFFLDSDNTVRNDIVSQLLTPLLEDENNAVSGSKIYYSNDPSRIWSLGAEINMYTSKCTHIGGDIDLGQFDVTYRGHFPCVYMIRKSVLDKVGEFDSDYFIMYEESDLQERIRKLGYNIILCSSAIAWHNIITISDNSNPLRKVGLFSKTRAYYSARNRIIFMKKNSEKIHKAVFFSIFLPMFTLYYTIKVLRRGRTDILISYLKGISDGIFKFKH